MYVYGINNMTFQVYIRSWRKLSCREGGQCTCEHMLEHAIDPENILTLILHSFIRSLLNFIFCQIRPIFSILIFWSKFKNAYKNVKLALKWWGFFSRPFSTNNLLWTYVWGPFRPIQYLVLGWVETEYFFKLFGFCHKTKIFGFGFGSLQPLFG